MDESEEGAPELAHEEALDQIKEQPDQEEDGEV
jgi:hypothetical protein